MNLGLHLQPGMRVGLYGGSFNPAHAGHRHVSEQATKRLGLHRMVWLVSPKNPLKDEPAAALRERLAGARARAPRGTLVSDAETRLGSAYTLDTVRTLRARYRGVRFVWVMGADNLAGFHRWRGWTTIAWLIPIAVIPRPGYGARARLSPLARRFAHARLPTGAAKRLPSARPAAWIDLGGPLNPLSSTALRAAKASAAALVA